MTSPAFYAIIPATVRYCKELEPNAKLLYGEITALAQKEGYCWASNKYFADLYEVDERSIQNWLKSLKVHAFIEIEIFKDGMQTTRKIWISTEIKDMFAGRKNLRVGMKISSGGGEENAPHINTYSTTEEKTVCIAPPVGSQTEKAKEKIERKAKTLEAASKGFKMPSETSKLHPDGFTQEIRLGDIFEASVKQRKDWSTDEIHDAWKILLEYSGYIRDPLRYIEGTIANIRNFKKAEYLNKNKKESEWSKTQTQKTSEDYNESSSENDTREQHSVQWYLDQAMEKKSPNGSKKEKTSSFS